MPSYSIFISRNLEKDLSLEVQEVYIIKQSGKCEEVVVITSPTRNPTYKFEFLASPYQAVFIRFNSPRELSLDLIKKTHHFVDEKELNKYREQYKHAQCIYSAQKPVKKNWSFLDSCRRCAAFSFERIDVVSLHTPFEKPAMAIEPAEIHNATGMGYERSGWPGTRVAAIGVALLGIFAGIQLLKSDTAEVNKKTFGI